MSRNRNFVRYEERQAGQQDVNRDVEHHQPVRLEGIRVTKRAMYPPPPSYESLSNFEHGQPEMVDMRRHPPPWQYENYSQEPPPTSSRAQEREWSYSSIAPQTSSDVMIMRPSLGMSSGGIQKRRFSELAQASNIRPSISSSYDESTDQKSNDPYLKYYARSGETPHSFQGQRGQQDMPSEPRNSAAAGHPGRSRSNGSNDQDRGPPRPPSHEHISIIASRSSGEASTSSLDVFDGQRSRKGNVYTQLSNNILDLARRCETSQQDLRRRRYVVQCIQSAVSRTFTEFPRAQVKAFGSFVSGLGSSDSDIDLVITGIKDPDSSVGFYQPSERPFIARLLDRLVSSLFQQLRGEIKRHLVIRNARIPVARFTLTCGLVVDLSIGGDSGPQAAAYLSNQVSAWPALRPLVLTVKSYLKSQGLNDVSKGGLSSYGMTYMEEAKLGSDTKDLGHLLCSFFKRYGCQYDQCAYVVAVGMGGVVKRSFAEQQGAEYFKNADRLSTVDPLTGRDCTEGCYETWMVMAGLERADRFLSSVVKEHNNSKLSVLESRDFLNGLMDLRAQEAWIQEEDTEPFYKRRRL
ncbi:hypothetical protein CEUSTIGMA_g1190.t1 [Chlamydomonas eustigma]|uniref:Poly(A) RNA polymerase mitochondrial-like central palm domain-containing protein n=1 Tax=Chlamydomonas eustigma TaxID=1157962 RepID=A0A250WSB6_9CHLO|nr:hypothetical protein CEUSTIGMA_g1190.t1 [Chlamydomonas eustigma]|eukprot:GAX73737.1 hypothetical protein CEUSTIGMA_g1190.t1 [Chlamydomonas eustigma]